jgi:molybdopterin synthase sulfur carrier subunit
MKICVKYFAMMRDITKVDEEIINTPASNPRELFLLLNEKYSLPLNENNLKVAINNTFEKFDTPFKENDIVAFIPPVAGG